jgi:dolichyl-phosphate beta-glucosyltransferase
MPDHADIRLTVIIPAFNEEERLPETLRRVEDYLAGCRYGSEVLVVDDGSSDRTGQVVMERAAVSGTIRLLQHADRANHGKGAAIRLGMTAASGQFRLFMDADDSTTIEQIEGFWPWIEQGYDIVIGSRQIEGARIPVRQPFYKEIAGRIGNLLIRALAVPGIMDTQAGFKLFSARSAEVIFPRITIDRWGFDVEALAIARAHGYRVREVPITWVNAPGSKVRISSYFQVLFEIWHIRRRLRRGLYQ